MDFVALPEEPKTVRIPLEKWKLSLRPCTSISLLKVPFAQLGGEKMRYLTVLLI